MVGLVAGLLLAGCADDLAPTTSDVHYINGSRVDAPSKALAHDGSGLLRNGVTPQPQGFD